MQLLLKRTDNKQTNFSDSSLFPLATTGLVIAICIEVKRVRTIFQRTYFDGCIVIDSQSDSDLFRTGMTFIDTNNHFEYRLSLSAFIFLFRIDRCIKFKLRRYANHLLPRGAKGARRRLMLYVYFKTTRNGRSPIIMIVYRRMSQWSQCSWIDGSIYWPSSLGR